MGMEILKGGNLGAHILSGCVLDPKSLNELFPNWKELGVSGWMWICEE